MGNEQQKESKIPKDITIEILGTNKKEEAKVVRREVKLNMEEEKKKSTKTTISVSTLAIIADKNISDGPDVAPPLHFSTNYHMGNDQGVAYSREDHVTRRRVEKILGELEGGKALVYTSGLASVAATLQLFHPTRVAMEESYFQTRKLIMSEYPHIKVISFKDTFEKGDLVLIESPSNPRCILNDIKELSAQAHAVGAYVAVDSTFATPILQVSTRIQTLKTQNPLELGADVVIHSCTKYLGGHSDLLGGVIATKNDGMRDKLKSQRTLFGSPLGPMECWLLLRSLRTLTLRVKRQAKTALKLALWLEKNAKVARVWHPGVASHPSYELCKTQMRAPPACFSFETHSPTEATFLSTNLKLFTNATSLGGVESLIDYRYSYDTSVSPCLLRLSIGLESARDLIADLEAAFANLPDAPSPQQV